MNVSRQKPIFSYIKQLRRPIFTTYELCSISGKSPSTVTQALNYLEKQSIIFKIYRGIWGEAGNANINAYTVLPFLFPRQRAYVSFISALHLYGIIEQIPQVVTVASTTHTRTIKTSIAAYVVHRIAPSFFHGFAWYRDTESFLIAEPEKALIDSLYISARKSKRYGRFPELRFPKTFSFRKTQQWARAIPDNKIMRYVQKRLQKIIENQRIA